MGGKICVDRLKLHLLRSKGKEITLDFKYSQSFHCLSWLFWSQALQCNECCLLFEFEQCPIYWHSTLLRIFYPLTKEQQRASNNTRELSKSQAWDFSKKRPAPFLENMLAVDKEWLPCTMSQSAENRPQPVIPLCFCRISCTTQSYLSL